MNLVLTMLVSVVAAVSSLAGQGTERPTWTNFVGIWHTNADEPSPTSPFLLNIRIAGDELTIERRTLPAATEMSRYRLDGSSVRTVQSGMPADATVAIEGSALVIKAHLVLPGGRSSTITESYTVGRSIMMMDRVVTVGTQTTTTSEVFQHIQDNIPLHGGVELR